MLPVEMLAPVQVPGSQKTEWEAPDALGQQDPRVIALRKADGLMVEAVRAKLRALVDGPLTSPAAFLAIEQTAKIGRHMLAVGKDPRALMRGRTHGNIGGYDSIGADFMGDDLVSAYQAPILASTGGAAENFGAQALRELVEVAKAKMEEKDKPPPAPPVDPAKHVAAIVAAKNAGLTEVAEKLEREMLGEAEVAS